MGFQLSVSVCDPGLWLNAGMVVCEMLSLQACLTGQPAAECKSDKLVLQLYLEVQKNRHRYEKRKAAGMNAAPQLAKPPAQSPQAVKICLPSLHVRNAKFTKTLLRGLITISIQNPTSTLIWPHYDLCRQFFRIGAPKLGLGQTSVTNFFGWGGVKMCRAYGGLHELPLVVWIVGPY